MFSVSCWSRSPEPSRWAAFLWDCFRPVYNLEKWRSYTRKMEQKRQKKDRMEFCFDFSLQLTSISSSNSLCPFLTLSISHSFSGLREIYLEHAVSVTYQSFQFLPSLGSEALGLKQRKGLVNFLIEQKPGDMKPHHEMHRQFLGLGGELWEQPAGRTNAQRKPLRWLAFRKYTRVGNFFEQIWHSKYDSVHNGGHTKRRRLDLHWRINLNIPSTFPLRKEWEH